MVHEWTYIISILISDLCFSSAKWYLLYWVAFCLEWQMLRALVFSLNAHFFSQREWKFSLVGLLILMLTLDFLIWRTWPSSWLYLECLYLVVTQIFQWRINWLLLGQTKTLTSDYIYLVQCWRSPRIMYASVINCPFIYWIPMIC